VSSQDSESVPTHVAIIMDGNGRWAKGRRLPRTAGHQQGVKTARAAIEFFARRGVKFLTLFAFSSENWNRPERQREQFPEKVIAAMAAAEESTAHCRQMQVTVAASYGGHWDIAQSVRKIAEKIATGEIDPQTIDADMIERSLSTADMPTPDLMIRTGGEQRISNFLIWQLAYTELYFTDKYWPQMDDAEFEKSLAHFQHRERRFGKTSEQLTEA